MQGILQGNFPNGKLKNKLPKKKVAYMGLEMS
jgi:hypothetical protein